MDLLQLEYFQTVARLEHITKAAKELHIAQPSLSQTIARLEDDLGIPLFDRMGKKIRLNESGKVFLKRVERIFLELEDGRREAERMSAVARETIAVAMPPIPFLPDFIGPYYQDHPNTLFRIFLSDNPSVQAQLESGEIDLYVSSVEIHTPDIRWQPLLKEQLQLAVPSTHRLASAASVSLHELGGEPMITLGEEHNMRKVTERICKRAGFQPNVAFEVEHMALLKMLVSKGLGIAFLLPSQYCVKELEPRVVIIPVSDPECGSEIGMAWSETKELHSAARQFRDHSLLFFKRLDEERKGYGYMH